jgi:hypothetical protein
MVCKVGKDGEEIWRTLGDDFFLKNMDREGI